MDTAHANVTTDTNNKGCKILKICDSWTKQWQKYVNVPLKWTNKDNNAFAKNKFRFSYNEVPWKYTANSQNTHAEVWPQQNCIATLLKSHFGTETTPQTRRLLLVRRPTKDCFWKENRIYEKKNMHNTNMMKYCAINLNER